MTILQFKRPVKAEPRAEGEAFCFGCTKTWDAAAPVGVEQLECPTCHRMTGRFKFPFAPPDEQLVRECACGNQFFWLTPDGHLCPNCGIYQRYD